MTPVAGILTADSGELSGAGGAGRAVAAGRSPLVHLTALEVARRAVVAHVQLGPPRALLVQRVAAADLTGLGPRHLRVVADTGLETENRRDEFIIS